MDNIFSFLNNQERNYIFMEIRQLEYFHEIAATGSIHERRFMSRPVIF